MFRHHAGMSKQRTSLNSIYPDVSTCRNIGTHLSNYQYAFVETSLRRNNGTSKQRYYPLSKHQKTAKIFFLMIPTFFIKIRKLTHHFLQSPMSVEISFTPVAQVAHRTVSDRWKMGQYPFEDFLIFLYPFDSFSE